MGRLDDLEEPAFLDTGVGDDQLVERPLRERVLDERRVALARELVEDAAATRAERLAQVTPRLGIADQYRLATHTDDTEHRAGDELVARTEKGDQRGNEDRADDVEPERREVLSGSDGE